MKIKRIINASVWAAVTILIVVLVVAEWLKQGCNTHSLIVAAVVYTLINGVLWFWIDQTIKRG